MGGVAQSLKNGSQWTDTFRTGPSGREGCARRRDEDDEEEEEGPSGCWPFGIQRGRSSLLMKSHLRPPFTLNMGHRSCPDLGFDPQRRLTPTVSPVLTPLCHMDGTHAYVYISARTPKRCTCTHVQMSVCFVTG